MLFVKNNRNVVFDYTETVTCRKFTGFVGGFHTGRNAGWDFAGACLSFQKCQHVGGSICVYHGSAVNVRQETAAVGGTCIIVIGRVGSQKCVDAYPCF